MIQFQADRNKNTNTAALCTFTDRLIWLIENYVQIAGTPQVCMASTAVGQPLQSQRTAKIIGLKANWSSNEKELHSANESSKLLTQLKQLIEADLANCHLKCSDICRQLGISRSTLHQKIKKATGKSLSHYIRELRLCHARRLLLCTTLNISEIAYDVGFSDPAYFTRVFTNSFGKSPSQFRRTNPRESDYAIHSAML